MWGRSRWGRFRWGHVDVATLVPPSPHASLLRRFAVWAALNDQVGDLVGDGESKRSDTIYVTVAGDEIAPSAPTLAATGAIGAIRLRITAPTTDANGKTLVDLAFYRLYISSTPAIDISNPATYDSMVVLRDEEHSHSVAAGTTVYFVASAMDKYGNESEASSEVSGTSQTSPTGYDIPDDATGLVFDGDPKVGDAMLGLLLKDPASSWVGFKHYELEYAVSTDSGVSFGAWTAMTKTAEAGYIHKGLTTTALYRYKYRGRPVAEDDTSSTTWDESDNGGTGWPDAGSWATDNSALVVELVLAERVVSTGEVRGEHFKATSYLAIGATTGFGDKGIQAQYNSGTPRFYVGDGANAFVKFDGTKLTWKAANTELDASGNLIATSATLSGAITATSGTIGGFTVNATEGLYAGADATRVQMKPGAGFWAGATAQGSAPFRVSAAGALVATSATISGTITCGAGSSYAGLGSVAYLSAIGAANCDVTIISGGKIITGLLTATNIQTGTLNCSLITVSNLSASSITTGTLSAGYISGGTLNFGAISRSALSVLNAELAGSITYDKISTVSASSITTGTLTGRDIRTASSGARAQMDAGGLFEAHTFSVYDASRQRVYLGAGTLMFTDSGGIVQAQIMDTDDSGNDYVVFFRCDSTTGGKPVLKLDQDDISEGFIDFIGSDRGAISGSTNSIASIRVELNGVVGRFAFYADA